MKIKANAKINLVLDVCSKRADGYHILDSVMQSVSLCDVITIEKAPSVNVSCSLGELSGDSNSAAAAAKVFFETTKLEGGANIHIEKNIPLSAGLGGGSADAAAVINGLNDIYDAQLSETERCEIGLSVGADVPFCIMGGTVRVGGIGEQLQKLKNCPECYLVIVKQGTKGSTGLMYSRLDSENPPHPDTQAVVAAIEEQSLDKLINNVGNSFAAVNDFSYEKKLLEETNPLCISLSGSGPSVFGIYKTKSEATLAQKHLKEKNINAFFAELKTCGTEIE